MTTTWRGTTRYPFWLRVKAQTAREQWSVLVFIIKQQGIRVWIEEDK